MTMSKRKDPMAGVEKSKAAVADPNLFKGLDEVELMPPSVKWTEVSQVRGVAVSGDVFHGENGPKRVLLMDVDGVTMALFESSQLRRLFDQVEKGDIVAVQTTGVRAHPSKKGQTVRDFKAALQHRTDAQRTGRPLCHRSRIVRVPRLMPRMAARGAPRHRAAWTLTTTYLSNRNEVNHGR